MTTGARNVSLARKFYTAVSSMLPPIPTGIYIIISAMKAMRRRQQPLPNSVTNLKAAAVELYLPQCTGRFRRPPGKTTGGQGIMYHLAAVELYLPQCTGRFRRPPGRARDPTGRMRAVFRE